MSSFLFVLLVKCYSSMHALMVHLVFVNIIFFIYVIIMLVFINVYVFLYVIVM